MAATKTERDAHALSVQVDIADISEFLQENLGQRLVALLAGGMDPKAVGRWASGQNQPRPDAERRLRTAFQVFHLLQSVESPHTVRAWFVGMNPQLEDLAPVEALAEDRLRDVLAAARAFCSGG
ncbi:MAG: hypothetical protein R2737_07385 [Candidatus Nanopelagicales bacterium]